MKKGDRVRFTLKADSDAFISQLVLGETYTIQEIADSTAFFIKISRKGGVSHWIKSRCFVLVEEEEEDLPFLSLDKVNSVGLITQL